MMRVPADSAEIRALTGRLLDLEHERSDARDQVRLLVSLQQAFTKIAVTRMPDEVIAQTLRAAYDPLGFSRAIYFSVDRERGVEARFEIIDSDVVEPSRETPDLRPGSALLRILRDPAAEGIGRAGELSAPLVDVRGWYILTALARADGTNGILYADGHRSSVPRDWETGLVRALGTIAAVSMDNSLLFAKTQELATRDPLTGLYNRRAFGERLLAEIDAARSYGRTLTYVMIDVDDFKAVNDSQGHAHGDAVLRRLAETLLASSRIEDIVGRYAGDEFVVLLTNVERHRAQVLVERLSAALRERGLRCSLGAALMPDDATDAASLLAAADRALYRTKAAGKNGYSFA